MVQSLADIILHLVFSTKGRHPWIQPDIEKELYLYMCGVCRNHNSPVIKINGVADHVHVLLRLGKTVSISKLIAEMKSGSSQWIKTKGNDYSNFAWQAGYGGFSVSRRNLEVVEKYIARQKEHHQKITFKKELVTMLQLAQIPYDEKYLWD
jgi:putative transposase